MIGVYIDGYNLYYGGRGICGRGLPGWRWLDLRSMCAAVVNDHSGWAHGHDLRIVFCTARIKGRGNPSSQQDQDVYLRAIQHAGSADVMELGTYVERTATAPLATPDRRGRPVITRAHWPLQVKNALNQDVPDAWFMASVARREEKGSDVNVATHLLRDVFTQAINAAVVVSNDSDLKLPVQVAKEHISVGLVNPTKGYAAGALSGAPDEGFGGHWWYQLKAVDFTNHQLPAQVGRLRRPSGW